jgi:hypothetical protein
MFFLQHSLQVFPVVKAISMLTKYFTKFRTGFCEHGNELSGSIKVGICYLHEQLLASVEERCCIGSVNSKSVAEE